ncbi:hypothetical protein ACEN2T_17870 [Pseudomonas sp. W22_MBD1_FP4]|uniref:hypothetical protein n=1 Tax=Pseudomonas sp. W22_MBD1_FP4 TaxID=3240272 RepID=UPI003F979D4C
MHIIDIPFVFGLIALALALAVSGACWLKWKAEYDAIYSAWEEEERAKEGRFQEPGWHGPIRPSKVGKAKAIFILLIIAPLIACAWAWLVAA